MSNLLPPNTSNSQPLPWELSSFACEPADPTRVLTLSDELHPSFTYADFVHWVAQWQQPLSNLQQERIALFDSHPGRFCASLWAIWHAKKIAVLPGDLQPETLAALDALNCARMGEIADALRLKPLVSSTNVQPSLVAEQKPRQVLNMQSARLCLFTSGSQGQPQLIEKTLQQLEAEVRTLDGTFGSLLAERESQAPLQVWTTVSHQHIYGLLFTVLWSLARGWQIGATRLQYPEDIIRRINAPALLIATPAHLKRLDPQLNWAQIHPHLRAVFSSGGPLPLDAARTSEQWLQQLPFEIFGSSETGGIAWRQSHRANVPWHPFPTVHWRANDGLLQVRSPHLAGDDWYTTTDRIAVVDNRHFELLGRSDRIVKIEEKRVSLTAIEQHLLGHPCVQEAKVLILPSRIGDRTAAVVVLRTGEFPDTSSQRHALAQTLRQWLRDTTEAVAIPKRWRFVHALPCNEQGKTTQLLLAKLFASTASVQPQDSAANEAQVAPTHFADISWLHNLALAHGPAPAQIECLHYSENHLCLALLLSPELAVFEGHFPGSPILPGVAQLDWTLSIGLLAFAINGEFQGLQALKFVRPITPGTTVHIELEYRTKKTEQILQFRLYSQDATAQALEHASGRAIWQYEHAAAQQEAD